MTTFQTLCIGTFLLAYYYFVLRTYNTLGFRMFSLFCFVGIGVCYWWYMNHIELKAIEHNGLATQAIVLKKNIERVNNMLTVQFSNQLGDSMIRVQYGGISDQEFAAIGEGDVVPILYSPASDTFFLTPSYYRQLNDDVYFLFFPAMLFLIGILCLIFLRKYRVAAHEGTIHEYLINEKGEILFDTKNSAGRTLAEVNMIEKVAQLFQRQ